jgi:hypothetical protein
LVKTKGQAALARCKAFTGVIPALAENPMDKASSTSHASALGLT